MKICRTEQEFIDYVAPFAQRVCKRYGFKPSILIAQAFHENGAAVPRNFDNNGIYDLMKYNCMVGQKARLLNDTWSEYSVWPGKYFYKDTPEEYGGRMVTINDAFRIFDSVEQSFADYVLFLLYAKDSVNAKSYRYGPEVVNTKDPHELIRKVGKKYATGGGYAENVWKVVERYDLTKYDDLTGVEPTKYIPPALQPGKKEPTLNINTKYITTNNTNSENNPIAIVIHNTDNFNKGANAYAHAQALHAGDISGMSWHYAVDDHSIYQCVAHNRGAWHVGKNYGSNNLFGVINNRNSICIEMCVNQGYDYEKAFQNTVALTKYLMKKLNIPASKVYQHYDICSKDCPSQIRKHGDWGRFKQLISGGSVPTPAPSPTVTNLKQGDKGEAVKTMQALLIKCGFSCGSAGADGVFGAGTANALKAFQKYAKLDVDGIYGPKSKAALEKMAKAGKSAVKQASSITVDQLLNTGKKTMDTARTKHYKYGDSGATDPTTDKVISCDRLIAKTLYDLGFKDQRKGGEVCGTLDAWLKLHGFVRSTKKADIKKGSILLVTHEGQEGVTHAFIVVSFNKDTWRTDRYDAGSDTRIQTVQPLKNESWGYRKDKFIVYNIPAKKEPKPTPKPTPTPKGWKAKTTATATVDDLNVRDKAGMEGKILRKLNKGNRFEVDGKTSGSWVHVNVLGVIGWVHKKYIKYD